MKITDINDEVKPNIIYEKADIDTYFCYYRKDRREKRVLNKILRIKLKAGNINDHATESFACHLIKDGEIKLRGVEGITSIERWGNSSDKEKRADLLIQTTNMGVIKVESKATCSKDGITTKSKNNENNYALVYMDFYDYVVKDGHPYINISIFYNLSESLHSKTMEGNGEKKIRFSKLVEEDNENIDKPFMPEGFEIRKYLSLGDHLFFTQEINPHSIHGEDN